MKPSPRFFPAALVLASLFAFTTISGFAAATLTQQIDPPEVNVGDNVTVTLTVQNGNFSDLHLPQVDGLQVAGTNSTSSFTFTNGSLSSTVSESFSLVPTRSGDFTIPAFDVHTQAGEVLHVKAMKMHVMDNGVAPITNTPPSPVIPTPAPSTIPAVNLPFNPNGPVVLPPTNPVVAPATTDNGNSADTPDANTTAPKDKDGNPVKVFITISPQTTDAYVGQSIPLRIDFYIRLDVAADQNSLPTIKGSDFLMNNFTTRGQVSVVVLSGQQYGRETWITAISAPKSGDFPLSMERDTYWIKSVSTSNLDPFFGGIFGRHVNLAHESISSNKLTLHVNALPMEGRPDHFTGAIGQFKVTGDAQPGSVAVGEPVTLRFTVSGEGNFDYVRCPVLSDDPGWKTYVPKSSTNFFNDESRTHGVKTFEQSIIPQTNGNVPLPPASFSYFDPSAKQYVTVPIALPAIVATGTPAPPAPETPDSAPGSTVTAAAPPVVGFLPNRLDLGSPQMTLTPVYRQAWFWVLQAGFVFLPLLGALFLFFRSRFAPDEAVVERALRQRSQKQEEETMAEAVRRGDAIAFFIAARHAIQLQLGAQWNLRPETITLGEIRSRDPQLAENLKPLFTQADEVIYSGSARSDLDLAGWENRVRTELLQPQAA